VSRPQDTEAPAAAGAQLNVGWEEYYALIECLAVKVHESGYAFDCLLCLARGGLRAGDVLSRVFEKPLGVLTVSSYRERSGTERGALRIATNISSIDDAPSGRVLLVDDLADSGLTLEAVVGYLRDRYAGIDEIRTAVIWLKACSRYRPDFFVSYLPDNPWINQPFERYDRLRADQLASSPAGSKPR